jgi:hypothetical protein
MTTQQHFYWQISKNVLKVERFQLENDFKGANMNLVMMNHFAYSLNAL